MPAETDHPLNAADAARSEARLADIELGLSDPLNRAYWRAKLDERIRIYEEDGDWLGLLPYEERELAGLKALRRKAEAANG